MQDAELLKFVADKLTAYADLLYKASNCSEEGIRVLGYDFDAEPALSYLGNFGKEGVILSFKAIFTKRKGKEGA